jgi:hypothetical protein
MPPGVKGESALPTSDYFFRYSNPESGISVQSTFPTGGGVSLTGGGVSMTLPKSTTFTPAQVNQSLVDFRAGERVGVGISPSSISTSTTTNGAR